MLSEVRELEHEAEDEEKGEDPDEKGLAPESPTEDELRTIMTVNFMGVVGPMGTLPIYYTQLIGAETAAGKPYRELVRRGVFVPLGMKLAAFLPSEVTADNDFAFGVRGYTVLAPDRDALRFEVRDERSADGARARFVDFARVDTANVVGLEDLRIEVHNRL